jgi:hypothetical protein
MTVLSTNQFLVVNAFAGLPLAHEFDLFELLFVKNRLEEL